MTNIDICDNIQIDGTEIEKVANCKYLRLTIAMGNRTKQEVLMGIKGGCGVSGKYRVISLDRHLPMIRKRKVLNQCVLPTMT